MKNNGKLSLSEARHRLRYDPVSGLFYWRVGRRAGQLAGRKLARGYIRITIRRTGFLAHRLAWLLMTGKWPAAEIDHVDLDPSNNAWGNLRAATRQQNGANRRVNRNNPLGIKGVRKRADYRRFEAQIKVNGKKHVIGYFDTPEEARDAYKKAADQFFGVFARA
jgi:hypothetical protein